MANQKDILMKGFKDKVRVADQGLISDLISKVFTTRDILHFAHWDTQNFSKHLALQELYEELIDDLDDIVEAYQGKFGLLKNLKTYAASIPECICTHIKEESKWIEDNKVEIAGKCPVISAIIDDLIADYLKAIYKLENLK
jgi:hypothetical protein